MKDFVKTNKTTCISCYHTTTPPHHQPRLISPYHFSPPTKHSLTHAFSRPSSCPPGQSREFEIQDPCAQPARFAHRASINLYQTPTPHPSLPYSPSPHNPHNFTEKYNRVENIMAPSPRHSLTDVRTLNAALLFPKSTITDAATSGQLLAEVHATLKPARSSSSSTLTPNSPSNSNDGLLSGNAITFLVTSVFSP